MPRLARSRRPFPETVQALMEWRGLTYRELAHRTGLSPGYLCHVAHGTRPVPDGETLQRIAKGLGVPLDFFIEQRIRSVARALPKHPELCRRLYTQFKEGSCP